MVEAFLGQDSVRKSFDLVLMELHYLPCFLGALLDDPDHFLVNLCRSFLAVNVVAVSVNRRVVGERIAHAETSHHLPSNPAHFLQIIRSSA